MVIVSCFEGSPEPCATLSQNAYPTLTLQTNSVYTDGEEHGQGVRRVIGLTPNSDNGYFISTDR